MTVCIAAICERSMVICASDRMITSQDMEFEPSTPKMVLVSNSVMLMMAGDSVLQTEIVSNVRRQVMERIATDPKNWWRIQDVTDLYVKGYGEVKRKRAEARILAPLGLNSESFLERQKLMNDTIVNNITSDILNFELPRVETIITGIDENGPHIFVVVDGLSGCLDNVGFAAVGSGAKHAQSELMFARHSFRKELAEGMTDVFSAKKRSEVAPGVGKDTDLLILGPHLGQNVALDDAILSELGKIFHRKTDRENRAKSKAPTELRRFLDERTESVAKQQQQSKGPTDETVSG